MENPVLEWNLQSKIIPVLRVHSFRRSPPGSRLFLHRPELVAFSKSQNAVPKFSANKFSNKITFSFFYLLSDNVKGKAIHVVMLEIVWLVGIAKAQS